MKRIMRPVDILVWSDAEGGIHPIRFRYKDRVVKINKVVKRDIEKFGGNLMLTFDCWGTADDNGQQRRLMLKYETKTCIWFLDKIE